MAIAWARAQEPAELGSAEREEVQRGGCEAKGGALAQDGVEEGGAGALKEHSKGLGKVGQSWRARGGPSEPGQLKEPGDSLLGQGSFRFSVPAPGRGEGQSWYLLRAFGFQNLAKSAPGIRGHTANLLPEARGEPCQFRAHPWPLTGLALTGTTLHPPQNQRSATQGSQCKLQLQLFQFPS